jgi:hypothetical protein
MNFVIAQAVTGGKGGSQQSHLGEIASDLEKGLLVKQLKVARDQ